MQCKPCSERVLSVKNEKGGREGRKWIGKISVRVEPRITGEVARERNKRIAASHPVTQSAATWREERMMMAPQVVGVLLKKPGQTSHSRIPPLDPQENKIRGELYVEELGERRIVCIRMGWLWVEGTSMRLPLRALNLRQAPQSHCQPHALALGFTLSNSQGDSLATFWADAEPIYWSWVRAIAAELVRQTPFRAQRCLNFLEILTICPRGPIPLPSDSSSPADSRRRSKSELRNHHRHRNHWSNDNDNDNNDDDDDDDVDVDVDSPAKARFGRGSCILEETSLRRRARSELRGWSSSNSSDEDLLIDFHKNGPKSNVNATGTWGCSESSEGSDDSLPWGGNPCRSSIDSVDYVATSSRLPPALETREQRIQKYKEVRRRENEARSRKVLEEDARRKKAEAVASTAVTITKPSIAAAEPEKKDDSSTSRVARKRPPTGSAGESSSVRFSIGVKVDSNGNEIDDKDTDNARESCGERRSRARERRSRGTMTLATHVSKAARKPSEPSESRIPIKISEEKFPSTSEKSSLALSIFIENPKEEDVARLLERCQRVDRYVPVRDKLTLFESLSRLGGRLARSTEDLGRLSSTKPSSPRGKQRARSLHDLNRAVRTVPVREMCRFFEGGDQVDANYSIGNRTDRTSESPPKRDNALVALSSMRLTRARISQRVSEKVS